MELKTGYVDSIHGAEDRDQFWTLLNVVLNCWEQ